MTNTPLLPPGNIGSKPNSNIPSSNFAKALLEAGGHAVDSTLHAGVGMMGDALSSLFGAGSSAPLPQDQQPPHESLPGEQSLSPDSMFAQQEAQEQEMKKREMRLLRHREVQQMEVFNRSKVEDQQQIKLILEQLEALSKDLDQADQQARQARITVMQGAPGKDGTYYKIFFERIIKVIMMLRQKVQESSSWLTQFNGRKSAQQGYWGQFYKNGTQWSMSQERAIATSVG